jgi:hypothetical protein
VPFPKKESNALWAGYFILPYSERLHDLHGHPMVNIVSGATFYIHDKSASNKPLGWLSLGKMEDEIDRILSRSESGRRHDASSYLLNADVGRGRSENNVRFASVQVISSAQAYRGKSLSTELCQRSRGELVMCVTGESAGRRVKSGSRVS